MDRQVAACPPRIWNNRDDPGRCWLQLVRTCESTGGNQQVREVLCSIVIGIEPAWVPDICESGAGGDTRRCCRDRPAHGEHNIVDRVWIESAERQRRAEHVRARRRYCDKVADNRPLNTRPPLGYGGIGARPGVEVWKFRWHEKAFATR